MRFKSSKKLWFHIDCDSFFAACEILRHPELKNSYVCVGGDIIIAATYNAKALGVKVGTPIWEAKRILPTKKTHYFTPDILYYSEVSHKLMDILRAQSCGIEIFSIDEAFCDMTGIPECLGMDPWEYATFLQKKILDELGISVTIGGSNTRLRAKIFSKLKKPFAINISLNCDDISEIFSAMPFEKIPFIGSRLATRLASSIQTIEDFRRASFWYHKRIIGVTATRLWLELNGVNALCFEKHAFQTQHGSLQKSFSKTRSFNHEMTSDKNFLLRKLLQNLDIFFEELYHKKCEIRSISVELRCKDFSRVSLVHEFPDYTLSRHEIYTVVEELLTRLYDPDIIYRGTGIRTGDIRLFTPKQLSLLDIQSQGFTKNIALESAISGLREKYGKEMVRVGG